MVTCLRYVSQARGSLAWQYLCGCAMGSAKNISEDYYVVFASLPTIIGLERLTLPALVHSHNEFAQKS